CPRGMMVTPGKPRAACTAASGFEAMATLPVNPISVKRRERAAASSCGEPNRRSSPEASTTTVTGSSSSTRGENSYAQPDAAAPGPWIQANMIKANQKAKGKGQKAKVV